MAEESNKSSNATPSPSKSGASPRLGPQILMMSRALFASPQRNKIIFLAIALVAVIGATAYGQIRLNAWNQPFYDALSRKNIGAFFSQLIVFGFIACGLLILNVAKTWFSLKSTIVLREGLVRDLFDQWLKPGRAFRLSDAGDIGNNPDQRIHEDARHLCELSASLVIGLLESSLLLGSFIGVLWMLSGNVTFHFNGRSFGIPGYMVWTALIYAGTASWLSWLVGRPLIQLNAQHYAQEAELRFALVWLNEHIDSVALYGGEDDEKQRLGVALETVLRIMGRIVGASTRLTWITSGYGWSTIVVPILLAAPGYFGGGLSFGALMMSVGAFNQVQQALRWFIDNFNAIADWRATLLRIATFRQALVAVETVGANEKQIEFSEASDNKIVLENLEIATPTGCAKLDQPHVEIAQGERVLISGESGAGKTILFRTIAGLWRWGMGQVTLPKGHAVMFMPRQPYVPLGTLRAALAYPSDQVSHSDEELAAALRSAGLDRLSSAIDHVERWDKELSFDEQQRLVFTRMLLHKPHCVVIDEALDTLDDATRECIIQLLNSEMKDTAVINIGRAASNDHFFTRILKLIKEPAGRCFMPDLSSYGFGRTAEAVGSSGG
ncbi:MAG: ABC transporter ATP-binding protein/permease [Verrucomicrobia bacterium]|nr:ABC transporter ATP-binding protein/permease [Verrucomicrobiota bacterium]